LGYIWRDPFLHWSLFGALFSAPNCEDPPQAAGYVGKWSSGLWVYATWGAQRITGLTVKQAPLDLVGGGSDTLQFLTVVYQQEMCVKRVIGGALLLALAGGCWSAPRAVAGDNSAHAMPAPAPVAPNVAPDAIAAKVNGKPITMAELQRPLIEAYGLKILLFQDAAHAGAAKGGRAAREGDAGRIMTPSWIAR